MSGSSNGFSGDTGSFRDSCEDLIILTQLASPKARVLQLFKVGSILDIAAQENALNQPLIVALYNGEVAGGISTPMMFKLLDCIRGGTLYDAEVLSIKEGQVKLRIRARK